MKPVIAVTVGDCNGIGPEVALKSLLHPSVKRACTPILVGPMEIFEFYRRKFKLKLHLAAEAEAEASGKQNRDRIPVVECGMDGPPHVIPGKLSAKAGKAAVMAIERAVELMQQGRAQAVVTAPLSKQAMHLAGFRYPGQTEMLQKLSSSPHVTMMLVSKHMRVGLVTTHIPISKVSGVINRNIVRERIKVVHNSLRHDWRIRSPRIAVLGLNPHAGEAGDIGMEDRTIISPSLRRLRKRGVRVEGPFPADSFFGMYRPEAYDAVVAMYHDQGLIPLKMSSFGKSVNYSAGLNIIRTSPDHGTAFDIAGKGIADPGSMIEAIKLAATIASRRENNQRQMR